MTPNGTHKNTFVLIDDHSEALEDSKGSSHTAFKPLKISKTCHFPGLVDIIRVGIQQELNPLAVGALCNLSKDGAGQKCPQIRCQAAPLPDASGAMHTVLMCMHTKMIVHTVVPLENDHPQVVIHFRLLHG